MKAKKIIEGLLARPDDIAILAEAREYVKNAPRYLNVFWTDEDFQGIAREALDRELTNEELDLAMHWVEKRFSADIGVNWDLISEAIQEVVLAHPSSFGKNPRSTPSI